MTKRQYYSLRNRRDPNLVQLDLPLLEQLIHAAIKRLRERQYFDEAFLVRRGKFVMTGVDFDDFFLERTHKRGLWGFVVRGEEIPEDDLFDTLEVLHDVVSKPVYRTRRWSHRVSQEGFDRQSGREEFRAAVNPYLRDYPPGYELSASGEIVQIGDPSLADLLEVPPPAGTPSQVHSRIEAAVGAFRARHSSLEDRRRAVRDLADALEFLRPSMDGVITAKDESELFNIANNFGIRHLNDKQKTDYEAPVWLDWMFYFFLATIHMVLARLGAGGALPRP